MADAVLDYLSKKYKGQFEILGHIGQSFGMRGDRWLVKPAGCAKEKDKEFMVFGIETEKGYKFDDSYDSVLRIGEYQKITETAVKDTGNHFKASVTISKRITHASDFKVMLTASGTQKSDELEKNVNAVAKAIAAKKLRAWIKCGPVTYWIDDKYRAKAWQKPTKLGSVKSAAKSRLDLWQLERLCNVVYLDELLELSGQGDLGDILGYILANGLDDTQGALPAEMTKDEWKNLIESVLADQKLSSLTIVKFVDVIEAGKVEDGLPGHRAVCFMDNNRQAYIIFRGTHGDKEWADNGEGMYLSDTVQQKASAKFVNSVREDKTLNVEYLAVAGHSKGGNKAQYVSIVCPNNYVNLCLSLDGQGFSPQFHEKYKKNIAARKDVVHLLVERRDFVNCLGTYLYPYHSEFHGGYRGDHTKAFPYGNPMPLFHCPNALRDSKSVPAGVADPVYIPVMLNQLVRYFLRDKKFDSIRQKTITGVVALLMKKKPCTMLELSEALANFFLAGLDLYNGNKEFQKAVIDVVAKEGDVFVATVLWLRSPSKPSDNTNRQELGKSASTSIAKAILKQGSPQDFLKTLNTLKTLVTSISKTKIDPSVLPAFNAFVEDVEKHALAEIAKRAGKISKSVGKIVVKKVTKIFK
ncbi:hypothetical protein AGMMS49938_04300 [Fibrobacterales bacterium]|nr:hypothetical protein AGMMS49938_04300 [Fibrobacterales bacterium]